MSENHNPNAVVPEEIQSEMDDPADIVTIRRVVIQSQHELAPRGETPGQPLSNEP